MKKRILLLEDDITLNDTLTDYLEENDYEVESLYDGEDAYERIYEKSFDLFLLDVNVPSINGFELLKNVREQEIKTPAIFITSLNSMDSFEEGFESGCDDYIRKPFELKELLIRIQTILKRGYFHEVDAKIKLSDDVYYDVDKNLMYKNDEEIKLNNKEAKLLNYFLKNQDIVLSHRMIYDNVWEYDEESSDFSLRTYIKNLRKIFGKERIISVKKLGYRFNSK